MTSHVCTSLFIHDFTPSKYKLLEVGDLSVGIKIDFDRGIIIFLNVIINLKIFSKAIG